MLSCKELVAYSDELSDSGLNLSQKLGMRMHLMLCRYCRRYLRQSRLLRRSLRRLARQASPGEVTALARSIKADNRPS